MLIHKTSKRTNLTKKAIEYYIEQKLICPSILENGYRDFSEQDIESLKYIAVLRKLGVSTEEVRRILVEKEHDALQKISVQKELNIQRENAKKTILDKLCNGASYEEVNETLKALEQSETITQKLLDAFPGYYGRFICLHFARFLNEPIKTEQQQKAYEQIISFLDDTPTLECPKELQAFLKENTKDMSTENINGMLEQTKHSIENPEKFIEENKEVLEQYMAFKQSEEYKNSPMYKIQSLFQSFHKTSGYYDVFIPALKKLSLAYCEYCRQIEIANEKFLKQYPEWERSK